MKGIHKFLFSLLVIISVVFFIAGCGSNGATSINSGNSTTSSQAFNSETSSSQISGKLDLFVLDVGQGDALLIKVGNEYTMIDTGDIDQRPNTVAQLKKLGVKKIKNLIISHPHADHIGGFIAIAEEIPIENVYDNGMAIKSGVYKSYIKMIEKKHINHKSLKKGDSLDLGNGARFDVYGPKDTVPYEEAKTKGDKQIGTSNQYMNNHSIAGKLVFGKYSLFTGGDAEINEETDMVQEFNSRLFARMLKIDHHGGNNSSTLKFIRSVKPESALISVGLHNKYGHPGHETLNRLQDNHITVYRTDTMGTIHVSTDGDTWNISTER